MKRAFSLTVALVALLTMHHDARAIADDEGDTPSSRAMSPVTATTQGTVNLSDASSEELERLPGIGPTKAARIIEYRKGHPFRKIEDLVKVKGIGKKTFAKLRPYLSLAGKSTLREARHK